MLNHKSQITHRHVESHMSSHTCQIRRPKSHITSHTSQITHVESPMSHHTFQIRHVKSHMPNHTFWVTHVTTHMPDHRYALLHFTFSIGLHQIHFFVCHLSNHASVGPSLIPRPSLRDTTSGLAGSCCCVVSKPSWSTVGIKTAFTEFLVSLEPPKQLNTSQQLLSTYISHIREMERNNDIWVCLHPLGQNISRTCYLKISFSYPQ